MGLPAKVLLGSKESYMFCVNLNNPLKCKFFKDWFL